ncbi:proteic killer suppression protein [Hymenobacter gelipurpurascens]|uniref:Proteic killer suppression protein n=1 Tax=Hymenobacter gelipurpurascens TaxID=89968 RepID=A0A212UHK9_9BACT|nr:type II toxin-antitoxin system RelE/ParE family toxin [Hymenobacter gelipurpurascens]SNC77732.1 proteic killer suppression protein [Hymenobacter gelipurpurascens]
MIRSIRHKGLKSLHDKGDTSKLPADNVERINRILTRLEAAKTPQALNFPGSGFHQLKGDLKDFYSIKVRANWKIIFRFEGEDVVDVDYLDYH